MTLSVAFRPTASAEYEEAAAWYNAQQTGLGAAFEAEVQFVLDIIAGQPDRYPIAVRDIREAPIGRFPFCVYYRVRAGRIVVTAVYHQSRDPVGWQSRG